MWFHDLNDWTVEVLEGSPQKFSSYFIPMYIVLLTCNLSTFFLLHLHLLRSTCQLLSTWLFHHKRSISSFQCYWTWLSQVSGIIYRHNVTHLVTFNRKMSFCRQSSAWIMSLHNCYSSSSGFIGALFWPIAILGLCMYFSA